jgi:hypothetical protein
VKAARALRSLTTVTAIALLASGLTNCADEPRPVCIASPIGFAAKLSETSRKESVRGACADFGPDSFNADPEIGLSPFYPQDSKGNPNFDKGTLGIRTTELGNDLGTATDAGLTNTAKDGSIVSLGPFTSGRPDDQGFCNVPTLSKTHVVLAAVPPTPDDPTTAADESAPGQPALDVTLEWSNVQVYVTAENYGTQFQADLLDTRLTPTGESCAISYHVVGLAPAVSCAAPQLDADGNQLVDKDGNPLPPLPDITLCDPFAQPFGSGIAANVKYECDKTTLFCQVVGDSVPSIN